MLKELVEIFEQSIGEKLNASIEIVDSIYDKSEELNDLLEGTTKESIDKLNGRIVLPRLINEEFKILISKRIIKDNINYFKTIFHELTHVWDYVNICKYLNIQETLKLQTYEYIDFFKLWTEFHASLYGSSISQYILQNLFNSSNDSNYDWHIKKELPVKMKYIEERIKSTKNDLGMQLYHFFIYFGEICFWSNLYPQFYNNGKINCLLKNDIRLIKLYNFCCKNRDFSTAIIEIEQIGEIIKGNS